MQSKGDIIHFDGTSNSNGNGIEDSLLLNGNALAAVQSSAISSRDTVIEVQPTEHTSGSSAIAMNIITNYAWVPVDIPGSLIDSHPSGNYIAYALQGRDPNSQGGMIRIIQTKNCHRGLIKNIPGNVTDLAFGYMIDRVLVACVDKFGSLVVYEIFDEEDMLRVELVLEARESGIEGEQTHWWPVSDHQRIIWCPCLPEDLDDDYIEPEDENNAYYLTVTNGRCAEIWHLGIILQTHEGSISRSSLTEGYQYVEQHTAPITDAAFSPDGGAIATASLDGSIQFFQVRMRQGYKKPDCVHKWIPSNGQPVSCLYFLDDYKRLSVGGLWKYAVTGTNNNTELKLWTCSDWHCHHTLHFKDTSNEDGEFPLKMKATVDSSSKFMMLSDAQRRVLYVLIIEQVPKMNAAALVVRDSEEESSCIVPQFVSVSEIPVQSGANFLSIKDAAYKPYKRWKHDHQSGAIDDCEEGNDMDIVEGLVIQCFTLTSKSLSEATVRFKPTLPSFSRAASPETSKNLPTITDLSTSHESIVLQDGLTDVSIASQSLEMESVSTSNSSFPPIALPIPMTTSDDQSSSSMQIADLENSESESSCVSPNVTTLTTEDDSSPKISTLLMTPDSFNPVRTADGVVETDFNIRPTTIEDSGEPPLATSEISSVNGSTTPKSCEQSIGVVLASSSASSPSLEVQQILHTETDKPDKFYDDDTAPEEVVEHLNLPDDLQEDLSANVPPVWETTPEIRPKSESPIEEAVPNCQPAQTQDSSRDPILQQMLDDLGGDSPSALFPKSSFKKKAKSLQTCRPKESSSVGGTNSSCAPVQEMPPGLFNLRSLPNVSQQITCSELEAHITASITDSENSSTNGVGCCPCNHPIIQQEPRISLKELNSGQFCTRLENLTVEVKSLKESARRDQEYSLKMRNVVNENKLLTSALQKNKSDMASLVKELDTLRKSQLQFQKDLPAAMSDKLKPVIENTIRSEMKTTTKTGFNRCMETLSTTMVMELKKLTTRSESNIAEQLSKSINCKRFSDLVANSASQTLFNPLQTATKDCYAKVLVPGIETITQSSLRQVNDAFSKGTREYFQRVEGECQSSRSNLDDNIVRATKTIEASSAVLTENTNHLYDAVNKSISHFTGFNECLETNMRTMIKEELNKALKVHLANTEARRGSRSQTPTVQNAHSQMSLKAVQQQIQTMISQQDFNGAFKQALMLSDLSLVVFVCERVNPTQLFGHAICPLTQEVLLSLINQLSHDLSTFTDLKIKYLEEAIVTLDMTHPVTKEHKHKVLHDLQQSLSTHLSLNPNMKKLKLLLLAVNQLAP